MKRILAALLMLSLSIVSAYGLTKNELKEAYYQMTIDDLNEMEDAAYKIANESARKTGYVKNPAFSMGGGGGFYYFLPKASINDNKPLSSQSISALYGGAGGFLVNLNPNLAVGGLFGGMVGGSSNKVGASYYSYSVALGFQMAHAQYKPIINDNFIVGLDLGLGTAAGGYTTYITNEDLIGSDIERTGYNLAYLIGLDVRKRITNTFFISGKLGIFSTTFDTLKRGDFTDPGKKLIVSAPYLALGLGGNF